jgi:hypothetical protein
MTLGPLDTVDRATHTPRTEQTGCFVGTITVIHVDASGQAARP